MSGPIIAVQRAAMHARLHDLSQPLTVVSLALSLAQSSSNEAERHLALEAATLECERAMQAIRQLRSLLDGTLEAKGADPSLLSAIPPEGAQPMGGVA